MTTIFTNSESSKTSSPHCLVLNLTDKMVLRRRDACVAVEKRDACIYYTWKNIRTSYKNNKFKLSGPTWNDKLELPVGSYSVSDIQIYFEYTIKKHETPVDNPPIRMYINRILNRISRLKLDAILSFQRHKQ